VLCFLSSISKKKKQKKKQHQEFSSLFKAFTQTKKDNGAFAAFVLATFEKCGSKERDVMSLLIAPVQRIPRYLLFCKQLIKTTIEPVEKNWVLQAEFSFATLCLKMEEKSLEYEQRNTSLVQSTSDSVVVISSGASTDSSNGRHHRRARSDVNTVEVLSKSNITEAKTEIKTEQSKAEHPTARPLRSSMLLPSRSSVSDRSSSLSTVPSAAHDSSVRSPRRKGSGKKKSKYERVVALRDHVPENDMGGLILKLEKGDVACVKGLFVFVFVFFFKML
jgi:hypothetical protein